MALDPGLDLPGVVHLQIVDDQEHLRRGVLDQPAQEDEEPCGVECAIVQHSAPSYSMKRIRPRLLTAAIMLCVIRLAVCATTGVLPFGA